MEEIGYATYTLDSAVETQMQEHLIMKDYANPLLIII